MGRLIDGYLSPEARTSRKARGKRFAQFTFDHVCQGRVFIVEDVYPELWNMLVEDNKRYYTTYSIEVDGLPKGFDEKATAREFGAALELMASHPEEGMDRLSRLLDVVTRVENWLYVLDLFRFIKDFAKSQPVGLRAQLEAFADREREKVESRP
ncbi:hypothetical protein LZ198_07265 [Myxococcus sp. K15C18031901]|uniref:hypothetical protein n=1 Tax=Myxococcus dinghuensis TaxID=2906761 RepID=UPI0020A82A63|nr:hypothetical protein [Myxococcus dinghuensis]MCP3098674.1 hypothetical protein [Myxococcus dinghuensis]